MQYPDECAYWQQDRIHHSSCHASHFSIIHPFSCPFPLKWLQYHPTIHVHQVQYYAHIAKTVSMHAKFNAHDAPWHVHVSIMIHSIPSSWHWIPSSSNSIPSNPSYQHYHHTQCHPSWFMTCIVVIMSRLGQVSSRLVGRRECQVSDPTGRMTYPRMRPLGMSFLRPYQSENRKSDHTNGITNPDDTTRECRSPVIRPRRG